MDSANNFALFFSFTNYVLALTIIILQMISEKKNNNFNHILNLLKLYSSIYILQVAANDHRKRYHNTRGKHNEMIISTNVSKPEQNIKKITQHNYESTD